MEMKIHTISTLVLLVGEWVASCSFG